MDSGIEDPLGSVKIVRETGRILAVCKPGGLLTQAPSGIDSVEVRIRQYLARQMPRQMPRQSGEPGKVYLGIPHRLDRPASGAMVFARDKKAARFLAEQFQRREVGKTYWALVAALPGSTGLSRQGTWTDWMRKVPDAARSEICHEGDDGAQDAILHYRICQTSGDRHLLQIRLETGRSHQIRLQASSRGFPILGDELYQSPVAFGPETDDQRKRCIALHARELVIVDPADRTPIRLTAEPPPYWPRVTIDPVDTAEPPDAAS